MAGASPSADPHTRDELAAALDGVAREVGAFFAALPPAVFAARPSAQAWSPGEHLAHLVLSHRPVAMALGLPRLLLRLRFGSARRASTSYSELRDRYRATLAAGGRAMGEYVPRPASTDDPAEAQRQTVDRWHRAASAVVTKLRGWDEASLDRLVLPHPLLGRLTVREILLFTLYHDRHHLDAVRGRVDAASASSA